MSVTCAKGRDVIHATAQVLQLPLTIILVLIWVVKRWIKKRREGRPSVSKAPYTWTQAAGMLGIIFFLGPTLVVTVEYLFRIPFMAIAFLLTLLHLPEAIAAYLRMSLNSIVGACMWIGTYLLIEMIWPRRRVMEEKGPNQP